MTRARAIDAPVDCRQAGTLLRQAERHLGSSRITGVDPQSAYAMRYDGARKACDAVLRAAGRRLTKGFGHHRVFFEAAGRLLGPEHRTLTGQLQQAARIRNGAEYDGRDVTQVELDALDRMRR